MFKLVVFLIDKHPYHAGIVIENKMIADLSLLGARLTSLTEFDFSNYKTKFFFLDLKNKKKVKKFINTPMMITKKIIDKERDSRGWFKTKLSSEYILTFRKKRSKNLSDLNCIEWIVMALEIGGYEMPDDILTAGKLLRWAKKNLNFVD